MITTTDIAGRVARATLAAGGATMALDGTVPVTGYAVALPGLEQTYPDGYADTADDGATVARISAYIDAHRASLERPDRYLGAWVDAGTLYLDTVEVFTDRDAAILAGIAAEQIAIFDIAAGEEIRLDTAQVTP
jgi:hypothetical protein